MQDGLQTTIRPTKDWQFNSRGSRLVSQNFDTKLVDRTNRNKLSAVLVLPVASFTGHDSAGQKIAAYPLFAAVAVDEALLGELRKKGLATAENSHRTMKGATDQADIMNRNVFRAYQDRYESAQLSTVQSWQKIDTDATPVIRFGLPANAPVIQAQRPAR